MNEILYAASPAAVEELMNGGGEFAPPTILLSDLTEEQATAVPPGSPYSIAQVVAHMLWNLRSSLAAARGESHPEPAHLDDTFAPLAPGSWRDLVEAILSGIEVCKRVAAEQKDTISPARDDTTVDYDLTETALHNAYHFGQIVLLRRMQGLWPPAGGDPNDF
jgi:hypothetical protein